MKQNDYINRQVVKETEKAFLVEVMVDNRRDGRKLTYKWVAKSVCCGVQEIAGLGKFAKVPTWIIGSGVW